MKFCQSYIVIAMYSCILAKLHKPVNKDRSGSRFFIPLPLITLVNIVENGQFLGLEV